MSSFQMSLDDAQGWTLDRRLQQFADRDRQVAAILALPADHPLQETRRQLAEAYGPRTGWAQSVLAMAAYLRGEWVPASVLPILEDAPWSGPAVMENTE